MSIEPSPMRKKSVKAVVEAEAVAEEVDVEEVKGEAEEGAAEGVEAAIIEARGGVQTPSRYSPSRLFTSREDQLGLKVEVSAV